MTNEERVGRLIDRRLYNIDAQYHAEARMFTHWLNITERALLDEGYTPATAEAVLDRIALGVPSGAEVFARLDLAAKFAQDLSEQVPVSVFVRGDNDKG